MKITIQLTSHADAARGETERTAEIFTVELLRNGDARDQFVREFALQIKRLSEAHNARFRREHAK